MALVGGHATASAWVDRMLADDVRSWDKLPLKSDHDEVLELHALFAQRAQERASRPPGWDVLHPPLDPATVPIAHEDPITEKPWEPWPADAYQTYAKRQVYKTRERARDALPTSMDQEARPAAVGMVTPREVKFFAQGNLKQQRDLRNLANVSGRQGGRRGRR